jgi:hypothetical protein
MDKYCETEGVCFSFLNKCDFIFFCLVIDKWNAINKNMLMEKNNWQSKIVIFALNA